MGGAKDKTYHTVSVPFCITFTLSINICGCAKSPVH